MKTLYLTAVLSLALASSHAATPAIENFQSDSGGTCFELTWPEESFGLALITPSGSDWIVEIEELTEDFIGVLVYPGSSLDCADDTISIGIILNGRDYYDSFYFTSCDVEVQIGETSDPRSIRVIIGSCPTGEDPGNGEDPGDGDADGDGVPDEIDHCPDTPAGASVFGLGCSFAQLIEPVCPCEFDWKNHGDYVSCVSKTADLLLGQGVISEEEKDAIVSIAAESKCGTKK
jgi:hypothetical protein